MQYYKTIAGKYLVVMSICYVGESTSVQANRLKPCRQNDFDRVGKTTWMQASQPVGKQPSSVQQLMVVTLFENACEDDLD